MLLMSGWNYKMQHINRSTRHYNNKISHERVESAIDFIHTNWEGDP